MADQHSDRDGNIGRFNRIEPHCALLAGAKRCDYVPCFCGSQGRLPSDGMKTTRDFLLKAWAQKIRYATRDNSIQL